MLNISQSGNNDQDNVYSAFATVHLVYLINVEKCQMAADIFINNVYILLLSLKFSCCVCDMLLHFLRVE